jgi:hypothetical protein
MFDLHFTAHYIYILQLRLVHKISYKYLQNITYMFCEILLYSGTKKSIKREGKAT